MDLKYETLVSYSSVAHPRERILKVIALAQCGKYILMFNLSTAHGSAVYVLLGRTSWNILW